MSCACGCGTAVRLGARFVKGHNRRLQEPYIVDPATGCWVWTGRLSQQGYATIKRDGRHYRAHRFFYEQARGQVPAGLQLDHLCRNRGCVNPDHLEPVTNAVNTRRGAATKLTPAQVLEIRGACARGEPQRAVADRFDVSQKLVWRITHEQVWKDLDDGTSAHHLERERTAREQTAAHAA